MSRRRLPTFLSLAFVIASFTWITAAYSSGTPSSAATYCKTPVVAPDATYTVPYTYGSFRLELPRAAAQKYHYALVPSISADAIKNNLLKLYPDGKFDFHQPKVKPKQFQMTFGYIVLTDDCASQVGHVVVTEGVQTDLTATPTGGPAPLQVNFASHVPNRSTYRYSIAFGDGTSQALPSTTATHVYRKQGTYRATFFVTAKSNGRRLGSASVTITVGKPLPTAKVTKSLSCTATYRDGLGATISADVQVKLHGTLTGSTYSFTTTSWTYSKARRVDYDGSVHPRSIGVKNQLRLKAPVKWSSPSTLGASGEVNTPNFTIGKGKAVQVQAIPDVTGEKDPSCTASVTV